MSDMSDFDKCDIDKFFKSMLVHCSLMWKRKIQQRCLKNWYYNIYKESDDWAQLRDWWDFLKVDNLKKIC